MLRNTTLLFGLLLLVFMYVSAPKRQAPKPPEPPPAPTATATEAPQAPDAGPPAEEPPEEAEAPPAGSLEQLFEGGKVPDLPKGAPRTVRFGVVLIRHSGAEQAPKNARSKTEALAKAKELLEIAKQDFGEAVKKGDSGSTAKAGVMPRGVLDPALQYVLFTLKKGEVYEQPIDTETGYWILRRY